MENFVEQEWAEWLDDSTNQIITRLRITRDFSRLHSFAIIYIHLREGNTIELVKVDGSEKERVNIHYYFHNPSTKEYHQRSISIETVEYYLNQLRTTWRWYLSQYNENYI